MLRALDADTRVARSIFIPSEASLRVFAEEMQLSGRTGLLEKFLGTTGSGKIIQHTEGDIGANVASGSYRSHGMVVLPCSMGTLAGIANGMASNLIERAADVCLKERPLACPLCAGGRHSTASICATCSLRRMRARPSSGHPHVLQPAPGHHRMVRNFVDRVLAHIGLPQPGAYEWKGD